MDEKGSGVRRENRKKGEKVKKGENSRREKMKARSVRTGPD